MADKRKKPKKRKAKKSTRKTTKSTHTAKSLRKRRKITKNRKYQKPKKLKKKKSNYKALGDTRRSKKAADYIEEPKQLSLSPFYSFSNHWSYITRQYLCLSSWGTCMGGINGEYDDLLDQEASHPLVEQSYAKELYKWNQRKDRYDKYNRDNTNAYTKINDDKLEELYNRENQKNQNIYNTYNVFNYPKPEQYQQYAPPMMQPPMKQFMAGQMNAMSAPIAKKKVSLKECHPVDEWWYTPDKRHTIDIAPVESSTVNTENIYNTYNTYNKYNENEELHGVESSNNQPKNAINAQKSQNNNANPNSFFGGNGEEMYSDNAMESGYNKGKDMGNSQSSYIPQNTVQSHSDATAETQQYKSGTNEPQMVPQRTNEFETQTYLASPNKGIDPEHSKGAKSFGRKFSMFEEAAELKKRKTVEQEEWKQQHHTKDWKPPDQGGVRYIEEFTYHPAAHHVQPHQPRKMSQKEYREEMRSYEDKDNIKVQDTLADLPLKEKIKLMQMYSQDQNNYGD